jgi:Mg/Co/Ni transporter MgtE
VLHDHLSRRDLDAARDLLRRTQWANLANVVRVLPEDEKRLAFDLLDPVTAAELRARLTTEERRDLDAAPGTADQGS